MAPIDRHAVGEETRRGLAHCPLEERVLVARSTAQRDELVKKHGFKYFNYFE